MSVPQWSKRSCGWWSGRNASFCAACGAAMNGAGKATKGKGKGRGNSQLQRQAEPEWHPPGEREFCAGTRSQADQVTGEECARQGGGIAWQCSTLIRRGQTTSARTTQRCSNYSHRRPRGRNCGHGGSQVAGHDRGTAQARASPDLRLTTLAFAAMEKADHCRRGTAEMARARSRRDFGREHF